MLSKQQYLFILNITLLVCSCLISVILLEIGFRSYAESGPVVLLSSTNWFNKYWHPINSFGFRDIEHKNLKGKRILYIVGDSFVCGQGINRFQDIFPEVLAGKLPSSWEVIILAQCGWGPEKEYEALVSAPYQPDMIVVSYCFNDIEDAAEKTGITHPEFIKPPSPKIDYFIKRSHLLNYLYWRVYRFALWHSKKEGYMEYLSQAYSNKSTWKLHEQELKKLIQYSKDHKSELIFLVFPQFTNKMLDTTICIKVMDFLRREHIRTIDLTSLFLNKDLRKLVVNPVDYHPNKAVHKEIGELLFRAIAKFEETKEKNTTFK